MQNGKDKPPSYRNFSEVLILAILSLMLSLVISINISPQGFPQYQYGDIAKENIKSPADIYIPKMDITLKKGEIIIREGERVSEEHLGKPFCIHKARRRRIPFIREIFLSFPTPFLVTYHLI